MPMEKQFLQWMLFMHSNDKGKLFMALGLKV
ncbi:hypothetical protein ACHAXH_000514 [Discostella pseudostelligera]